MARLAKQCQIKTCENFLGPGAATIGYEIDGKLYEIKACRHHVQLIQIAPRGTWELTKDRELKPIPAKPFIQFVNPLKKGKP